MKLTDQLDVVARTTLELPEADTVILLVVDEGGAMHLHTAFADDPGDDTASIVRGLLMVAHALLEGRGLPSQ